MLPIRPKINSHVYGQMIFKKGAKIMQLGKNLFSENVLRKQYLQAKEESWTSTSHHIQNLAQKVANLNVRVKTTKPLGKKIQV